jgi:hypothetical protein
MNLPAAVIAAMALCNQHIVATQGHGGSLYIGTGYTVITTCSGLSPCVETGTDAQRKARKDAEIASTFSTAYAWEPSYEEKCKTIQDYVTKFQASLDKKAEDKKAAENTAAEAAKQPTLDKGIAALPAIKSLQP